MCTGHIPLHHCLSVPDGWIGVLEFGTVVSVQVTSRKRASIVPHCNSIRVQHWYHLEDKCVSENLERGMEGKTGIHDNSATTG